MIDLDRYRGRLPADQRLSRDEANDRSSFREQLRVARPDLAVFRAQPWWQRMLTRLVWRVAPGWSPRGEREAMQFSQAFKRSRDAVPLDIDLEV